MTTPHISAELWERRRGGHVHEQPWPVADPAKLTVGIWFAGTVTGGTLVAGDDADAVGWFHLDDLPSLAFETDEELFERLRAAK